jgi:Ca2+-binding EF-hand superfamily protein
MGAGMDDEKLEFVELQTNQDFKTKICLPYFKDIYKDLVSRSDNPQKGINKVSLLDYAQLPGVLGERFFDVMDSDDNGYLDQREFLTGLFRLYCSTFDEKTEFIFEIYDFDSDGFITKSDVSTILASLPVINFSKLNKQEVEGKFTQEGGGLDNFEQRCETIEEMNNILDICFEGKQRIDPAYFKKMNEDISSDTVLALLGLFRERLPCSENFWRYKRNYDLYLKMLN